MRKHRYTAVAVASLVVILCLALPSSAAFEWVDTGNPGSPGEVSCLAYDAENDVLFAGTRAQGVWRLRNASTASSGWGKVLGTGTMSGDVLSLAYDGDNDILYAGTSLGAAGTGGVFRRLAPNTTGPAWVDLTDTGAWNPPGHTQFGVTCLAFDDVNERLYAGTWADSVWRLGNPHSALPNPSWFTMQGPGVPSYVNSLLYDPATTTLYCGLPGSGGFYRCNAPGKPAHPITWTLLGGTIGSNTSVCLALDPANNVLFASTKPSGVSDYYVYRCPNPDTASPVTWTDLAYPYKDDSMYQNSMCYDGTRDLLFLGTSRGLYFCQSPEGSPSWQSTGGALSGTEGRSVLEYAEGGALFTGDGTGHVYSTSIPEPTVSGISPEYGVAGDTVTITGDNFGALRGSSYVSFGSLKASGYSSWKDDSIKCEVPPGLTGTSGVSVTTYWGGESNAVDFTLSAPRWYLAEGSTDWGFGTYITVENPNSGGVDVRITYNTRDGEKSGGTHRLAARSQATFNPSDVIGATDFSTVVECTSRKTIAVDRTMSWTGPGQPCGEAHASVGVTAAAANWYLPEGSSDWGFECWLLIQNPNSTEAVCTVTYMIEDVGPREFTKRVPAGSRATYDMSKDIGAADASIQVKSDSGHPVIPERAMYRDGRREGHDSIGTTSASEAYYLAEGSTAWGFTTYVLVQNPNNNETEVTLTYMTDSGPSRQEPFAMAAKTRKTIRVNDYEPGRDLSTLIEGSHPIIAERAMYWKGGPDMAEVCHDSIGMDSAHARFFLPDGQTDDGRETWTLVQNPNASSVPVRVTYLLAGGGTPVEFTATVPGRSRVTFNMAVSGVNGRAAVEVRSLASGKGIMVERAMYWSARGAGTDTIGGYSD